MSVYRGLGVAYYPEHWSPDLWEDDVIRMRTSGLDTVRIGEFSWGLLEPREGEFAIGYFDEFVEICARHGLKVIFGTPTATPPVWMQRDYPEILNCDRLGNPIDGPRRNYTYNSSVYRAFCGRIVTKLAEHYGDDENVVGWQIDNELNCEIDEFFSESDHAAFREYMQKKHGSLDQLNAALGATFWGRTVNDWKQVRLGGNALHGSVNPHLALEEKRFFSASAVSFLKMQVDIIRKYAHESQFVTTNGLFGNLNYTDLMNAGLDFITFDSYPNFARDITRPQVGGEGLAADMKDRAWSWNLAWTRSISPTFGIMEQQSGAHGWTNRMEAPAPKPGQMRLWTMQSIAHGADMVCYFRWRTSPMGAEIYWHGLNDYSNRPNRRVEELGQIAREWQELSGVQGARYEAHVAVLRDYDNSFDEGVDAWHARVARQSDDAWFRATQFSHTPTDFVDVGSVSVTDLNKYRLIVYPHPAIITESVAELLRQYVEAGGHLVLGARTGYKDEAGKCPMREMPGLVDSWLGCRVNDYTLVDAEHRNMRADFGGQLVPAPVFNEVLEPTADDVQIVATYADDYYAGQPAVIRRQVGKGQAFYVGSCFSPELAMQLLLDEDVATPYRDVVTLPPQMELAVRTDGARRWLFALNYSGQNQMVQVKRSVIDQLSGEPVQGPVTVEPYGVLVLLLEDD